MSSLIVYQIKFYLDLVILFVHQSCLLKVYSDRLAAVSDPISSESVHIHHQDISKHDGGMCVGLQRVEHNSQERILQLGVPRYLRYSTGKYHNKRAGRSASLNIPVLYCLNKP